jgi:hypothetical protein
MLSCREKIVQQIAGFIENLTTANGYTVTVSPELIFRNESIFNRSEYPGVSIRLAEPDNRGTSYGESDHEIVVVAEIQNQKTPGEDAHESASNLEADLEQVIMEGVKTAQIDGEFNRYQCRPTSTDVHESVPGKGDNGVGAYVELTINFSTSRYNPREWSA